MTPLHEAAASGRVNVIQTLVECGAEVNARDELGGTPLMVLSASLESIEVGNVHAQLMQETLRTGEAKWIGGAPPRAVDSLKALETLLQLGADASLADYSMGKVDPDFTLNASEFFVTYLGLRRKPFMTFKAILLALLLVFSAMTVSATLRYVNVNSTNATSPYTNWATAASVIQDAIDAGLPGDEILVTNGIYQKGGAVVVGNPLTNRVSVTKPVTVKSVNGPGTTFIMGYQVPGTTNGDTAVRCVYLTNGAMLAGFTLTGGATRDTIGGGEELSGGGVFCASLTAVVSNCVLVGNSAGDSGGGAYSGTLINCMLASNWCRWHAGGAIFSSLNNCLLTGNSAILTGGGGAGSICTLKNCTLISNSASYGGGTEYCSLTNCMLTGNSSGEGGATYGGMLTDCTLTGNSASSYGGGAYYGILNNCTLAGNSASYAGGGAHLGTLNNCTLTGNSASFYGGGASVATLNNCTMASNSAAIGGGGYYDTVNNCTLTGNSADEGGGSYSCLLNNCIVYYNFGPTNANYSTSVLNYCCTAIQTVGEGLLKPRKSHFLRASATSSAAFPL